MPCRPNHLADALPVRRDGAESPAPRMVPPQTGTGEFATLALARAYIDTTRERISSLAGHELIEALARLDSSYYNFPELEFDLPRKNLIEELRSAAENMPTHASVLLLMYCFVVTPSCSRSLTSLLEKINPIGNSQSLLAALHILLRSAKIRWCDIKTVITVLRQQGRADIILQVLPEILDHATFSNEAASELGDVLAWLLDDQHPLDKDAHDFAKIVLSARDRLSPATVGRSEHRPKSSLLAMADRFGTVPVSPGHVPRSVVAWPSGRMSFSEFLLQWPCEIELPIDLDDATLIEEAYRAILLRDPDAAEMDQYLRLLRDGVSKLWILEDLLASEEPRSLDRRLRVIYGDHVITEPGRPADAKMAAVVWPWRSAD
jgi:hypothetical protein